MERFTGLLGIAAVLAAAYFGSTNRKAIRWRTVAWGLGLQVLFAFLVLRFDLGRDAMSWAGNVVQNMLSATFAGTKILFGDVIKARPRPPRPAGPRSREASERPAITPWRNLLPQRFHGLVPQPCVRVARGRCIACRFV